MQLKQIACSAFDANDANEIKYLTQLWSICFKDELKLHVQTDSGASPLENPLWKKIGFQSDDPVRDIRGTGSFGLRNLLYFAEKYPQQFRKFSGVDEADKDTEKEEEGPERYPFVVGAFNVTMMLYELLGWGWKTAGVSTAKNAAAYNRLCSLIFPPNATLESSVSAFNEIFCTAVFLLDDQWTKMGATYMQFPNVMIATQERFEKIVLSFRTPDDVQNWNYEARKTM
jgi:hypothetical protein